MEEQLLKEMEELKESVLRLEAKMDIVVKAVGERARILDESRKTIKNINSVFKGNNFSQLFEALVPQDDPSIELVEEDSLSLKSSDEVPFE